MTTTAMVRTGERPKASGETDGDDEAREKVRLSREDWPAIRTRAERLLALAARADGPEARTAAIMLARLMDKHDLRVAHEEFGYEPEVDPILAPAKPGESWASRAGFGELCGYSILWQDRYDRFLFGYLTGPSGRPLVYMNPHDAFREVARLNELHRDRAAYAVVPVHKL